MEARNRLGWQQGRTGYDDTLVGAIAEAALPAYRAGGQLSEPQLAIVCDAIDALAQAGLPGDVVREVLTRCRRRGVESWRERFWRAVFRFACERHDDAARWGVSPVETDPIRLARWGPAPDWTQTPQLVALPLAA